MRFCGYLTEKKLRKRKMKTVIWLVKVKGLAQDEVARRLNISQQRVSVVLKQTIEKLKKLLKKFDEDGCKTAGKPDLG